MYRAFDESTASPRQSKVVLQRQYREKEGECFSALRGVINELTGEELQTRQEILRKAIDLLLAASERRKSNVAAPVQQAPYAPAAHHTAPHGAIVPGHIEQPTGPSQWIHDQWQSAVEFDAQVAYYASQRQGQQHHMVFNAAPASMNQASSQYSEDWSFYH